MLVNNIVFEIITHCTPEYLAAVELREEILRRPLGLSFSPEDLESEKYHIHIAGYMDKELVATCVLVPKEGSCKMQRVAVKDNMQGSGVGSQMLVFCEEHARTLLFKDIYCHARATAVQFYLRNNYVAEGSYFEETTIPHLKMRKLLK